MCKPHPWLSFLFLPMFSLHCFSCSLFSAAIYVFLHATSNPFWEEPKFKWMHFKNGVLFSVEIFAGEKEMCIETRHDLTWRIHVCVCRIWLYVLDTLWSLQFSRFLWSSGFRGNSLGRLGGETVFYSRPGIACALHSKESALGFSIFRFCLIVLC